MHASPTFRVDPEIFGQFPDYIVGFVLARGIANDAVNEHVSALLADAEDRAQLLHANRDLKQESAIAVWRSVFSTLGWSASKFPASVESMVKRVSRGGSLPRVNPAVDLANAATLLYLVPVGCHDLSFATNLQVRLSAPQDAFLPVGDADAEAPPPGEIVYAAGHSVRTRRWVWRQSRDALVGSDATTILFPVDGFAGVTDSRVEAATEFLFSICKEHLSADVRMGMISRHQPDVF